MIEFTNLAPHAQDDGFHEIQLNGKQLVFVFMAATVVSVVIFLCGVLVGRGVRSERGASASLLDSSASALNTADEGKVDLAASVRPPTVVQPGDDPTKAPPPAPPNADGESSSEAPRGTAGAAKPPASEAAKPSPPAAAVSAPKPADSATTKPAANAAAAETVSPGQASDIPAPDDTRQGWVVQVAATKTRGEADTCLLYTSDAADE